MNRFFTLVALCVVSICGVAAGATKARPTTGTVWAGVTHSDGGDLYVAGDIKDKILGRGAIVFITQPSAGPVEGSVLVKARRITLYTPKGALIGRGQATQTGNPDGTATVSDGTFTLVKGTGKQKGHKLTGTFSGTYADGVYTFTYKGTYR
jgi:hypothetical protein